MLRIFLSLVLSLIFIPLILITFSKQFRSAHADQCEKDLIAVPFQFPDQTSFLEAFKQLTTVQLTNIPGVFGSLDDLPTDIIYYIYDAQTGQIHQASEFGVHVAADFKSLDSFRSFFSPDSYFPFIFDVKFPQHLIIGLGAGTRDSFNVPVKHSLARNGGHFQLARKYRNDLNPQLEGLFGGGMHFDVSGRLWVELTSRSVNGSPNGQLSLEQDQALKQTIYHLLTSP